MQLWNNKMKMFLRLMDSKVIVPQTLTFFMMKEISTVNDS